LTPPPRRSPYGHANRRNNHFEYTKGDNMIRSTKADHVVPSGLITHCTAVIRGHQHADITCHHARTADARITLVWGGVMITLYSAAATHGVLEGFVTARAAIAQVPREIPPPASVYESSFARPTVAIEFTGRPTYAVVQHSGPARTGDRVIHWVDLHMGPITWQIRDQVGLRGATELLHRAYKSAVAIFLDGDQHRDDPTSGDHPAA
jgi:hypothetical protein